MARPSKRTPEVEAAILAALEIGNTRTDSAMAAGVHPSTLERWTRRYAGFRSDVERAEAKARMRMVGIIAVASQTTWQAAAWYLERRNPAEWGRRERLEVSIDARQEAERLARELGGVSADEILAEAERIASGRR